MALKPFRKGDGRIAERSRGGKSKTLFSSMTARKWCNKTCTIKGRCMLFELSQKEKGKPCLLKKANSAAQKRMIDIVIKDSPEALEEFKRILIKMGDEFDNTNSLKGMAIYADKVKDLQEMVHGKKGKLDITADVKAEITIEDFKRAMKEMEEE